MPCTPSSCAGPCSLLWCLSSIPVLHPCITLDVVPGAGGEGRGGIPGAGGNCSAQFRFGTSLAAICSGSAALKAEIWVLQQLHPLSVSAQTELFSHLRKRKRQSQRSLSLRKVDNPNPCLLISYPSENWGPF